MAFLSEKELFLQSGKNRSRDSGLVLSTDAKPRLKWTPDLHERFIRAVNQLGGTDKATPKSIMKVMGIRGLTLYHLKSHLQKYRLSKNLRGQTNDTTNNISLVPIAGDKILSEADETCTNNFNFGLETNRDLPINEAPQMQIEVQRRLHEQLEVQRHLKLRIEAQGKYLEAVLEKAQKSLREQIPDTDVHETSISVGLQRDGRQINESGYGASQDKNRIKLKPTTTLDLNTESETRLIDLNGFNWS